MAHALADFQHALNSAVKQATNILNFRTALFKWATENPAFANNEEHTQMDRNTLAAVATWLAKLSVAHSQFAIPTDSIKETKDIERSVRVMLAKSIIGMAACKHIMQSSIDLFKEGTRFPMATSTSRSQLYVMTAAMGDITLDIQELGLMADQVWLRGKRRPQILSPLPLVLRINKPEYANVAIINTTPPASVAVCTINIDQIDSTVKAAGIASTSSAKRKRIAIGVASVVAVVVTVGSLWMFL